MALENLLLDDFTHYKFLSEVKHSPDGKHACYITHEADLDENNYNSKLWIYDFTNKRNFQLTELGKVRSFLWLANSQDLLFSSLRDPKDQEKQKNGEDFTVFFRINIKGGEAREYFRIPLKVQALQELSNDRFLLTVIDEPHQVDWDSLSKNEKDKVLLQHQEEQAFQVLEELPFWSNGQGFISGQRTRLYLFDKNSNEWEVLTPNKLQVSSLRLNDNNTKAIIIGKEYEGKAEMDNALYMLDIPAKSVKRLTPPEQFTYQTAHFFGEEIICLGTDRRQYGMSQNPCFYLVDPADGVRKSLIPNWDVSTRNSVGSDCRFGGGETVQKDGDFLYFLTTEGDSSYLNRLNRKGNLKKVSSARGSVDSYSVKNGQIVFIGLRGLFLQELYSLVEQTEQPLTAFNTWVTEKKKLSQPQPLSFEVEQGTSITGWVLLPIDYEPGQKYPGILNIHGGPKTVYGTVFFHEMQYWANRGYFVFFCNPRGSDGQDNAFADLRGKYGTIDYQDLMQFTDLVLNNYPDLDKTRLGVAGGSYGGFMTNWIIGQTDRFQAAASQRSISNWFSMAFTTDIGYFFAPDQIGATPWSNPEKLWEHSPLKYAHQVKTPTLFIHSEEDYRCWLPEGLQMFSALKYHGVTARLCWFRGENHELSRSGKPKGRIRRLQEITDWFDHYLKPEKEKKGGK